MSSKLVSCSVCFKVVRPKQTVVVEYKRVCHDCNRKKKDELLNEHESGLLKLYESGTL
jgi:hypothetical protein